MIEPEDFRIFAHRGASGSEPENTILAIEKAIDFGAKWIEIDIQFADGEIFVFHDDMLERLTDGKGTFKGKTKDYLRSLNAGKGCRIPYLYEVFNSIENRVNVNIEIKDNEAVLPLNVLLNKQLSNNRFAPENFIISSYETDHIKVFRSQNEIVPCAFITDEPDKNLIRLSEQLNCKSLHINFEGVTEDFVQDCHSNNIRVYVFTVNKLQQLNEMKGINVDGIFTDYPELLIK